MPKSVPKWKQNLEKCRSRGGSEALGEPPGAKMPQGADWDALGAPFGGLWEHILAPRWAKMGQDGAKLANFAPRCGQDGAHGA